MRWNVLLGAIGLSGLVALAAPAQEKPAAKVSYDKQIRPLLQGSCHACHQPAKSKGEYVMTSYDRLLAGGESKAKAVTPGHPEQSKLIQEITPDEKGKAEMPKGGKPLAAAEIELIKKWIAEGAVDDTPVNAKARFDMTHLPVYSRPPVLTSIDFSPDGGLLAVAGFHEVLLMKSDGSECVARLVGLSERIQSLRFSPDGTRLAVSGGLPCRMGEIQVWDVEKKALALSAPVTQDTLYGLSWSPDGKSIAFGCADKSVRAINAKTGEQILYQGTHEDLPLDTVFSTDGSHVVSVGRDMTAKLTEVATQRFVDGITSITPGALKGGIATVARHPQRDEIVIGGSDGQPKVYRMHRLVQRKIGDDSNLIRNLPPMRGRIWSVAVSADGKRIVAGSGLDGRGEVAVYTYEFDTTLPNNVKVAMAKVSTSRNQQDRKLIEQYHKAGVAQLARADVEQAIIYSVAFRPDGASFAAAGSDGVVRLYDTETAKLISQFSPAPVDAKATAKASYASNPNRSAEAQEKPPASLKIAALEAHPAEINLTSPFEYAQCIVTARLESGERIDVTRWAESKVTPEVASISLGVVEPRAEGRGTLQFSLGGRTASVSLNVLDVKTEPRADFIRDVNPVMSRVGCNAGLCHGSAKGKNGFKLSLRGYDSLADVRSLTDDLASRRVAVASPDDSLMLLKATGAVPHEGGRLFQPGDVYYRILRNWISNGVALDLTTPKVSRIDLYPMNPVVERLGVRQQFRVCATYADGRVRDVTRESFIESGNTEVATAERGGLLTAVRRGEASVLARYDGAYAATTLTVMGDRSGFVWEEPPAWTRVDELVAAKWKRLKIKPSDVAGDADFLRRVAIDLTGLPPTAEQVRAFLADTRETRAKREVLVDSLIGNDAFIEHWSNKWADLLQVNRKFLGTEGSSALRAWIRQEVAGNTPYDQFVRKIVTSEGSTRENPAASYFKILREPDVLTENTTHLFLAVRFNCTKCHDHPFERWTQDQYYETAAFFAHVGLKDDPKSGGRNVNGTSLEGSKSLYEIVYEKKEGEVKHERTGKPVPARFPYPCRYEAAKDASPRQEFAAWLTSPDNVYFARSFVNRLWGYLFGPGIIDPVDDIRAGNPASNPELLEFLTKEFIQNGFDVRKILRLIVTSRVYQLSLTTNKWNEDDKTNYSHALARRLSAEVLFDAVYAATGAVSKLPGVPPGTRAASLPDSGVDLPGGFLATFGRPPRESPCECERTSELRLGAVMALMSGPMLADAIADPESELTKLSAREQDPARLVEEIYLRILNRPAKPEEVKGALDFVKTIESDNEKLAAVLKDREAKWAEELPKLEQRRVELVKKLEGDLEARRVELEAIRPKMEQERAERAAKAKAEMDAYKASLPERIVEWEKKQERGGDWVPLVARDLSASNGAKLVQQPDLSVIVTGDNVRGIYTFEARTDLRGIAAVRLEVLSDPSLPNGGPGRNPEGNFLLTQFELNAAPDKDGVQSTKVPLQNARADFSNDSNRVEEAISGAINPDRGWSVEPAYGVTHWAVFDTRDPLGYEGGTMLIIKLRQSSNTKNLMIGRFRISVTPLPPTGPGLSDELRVILSTPLKDRTEAQTQALFKYYSASDPGYRDRSSAVTEAGKPFPPDAKLTELKAALAQAEKPVATDPKLSHLRADVGASQKQIENKRLTLAQDLAWALINSPAFMFNH